jgi:hypothetical protein
MEICIIEKIPIPPTSSEMPKVGSRRKCGFAPRRDEREEARRGDAVAAACVPDRRHRRDAELDHRPADRPAHDQQDEYGAMATAPAHATLLFGCHASALN